MALQTKLNDEELALVEILEDPIWCGEFLRNTANGEINAALHTKTPFKYRHYQKDLLSDRTDHVSLVGGRSIGKCQPGSATIYTTEGYKTIAKLWGKPSFPVYCLDEYKQITVKRATVRLNRMYDTCYTVTTKNGYTVTGTNNHPLLTPEGWKEIQDLAVNEPIAVVTWLPEIQSAPLYQWHELRYLGYMILQDIFSLYRPLNYKYKRQLEEYRLIAKAFDVNFFYDDIEKHALIGRRQPYARYKLVDFFEDLGIKLKSARANKIRSIPASVMTQNNASLKIFLEALFSLYADISLQSISLVVTPRMSDDLAELLLRFGVVCRREIVGTLQTKLTIDNSLALYRFFTSFDLPGIGIDKLKLPDVAPEEYEHLAYDPIVSIEKTHKNSRTFAVVVQDEHNYISTNVYVHNSLVLEDKIIYETVNTDICFSETHESVLATSNQAQLTPLLNRLILRFTSSPLLKHWLRNGVNRAQGTLTFPAVNPPHIIHARIAGSRGEQNMVGLHVPRIVIDEAQIFSPEAYTQLAPALNQWEKLKQWFVCGVPSGLRSSVLYQTDQKLRKYKKYRIPSHNNPYYSYENDQDNIRTYSSETSDDYQRLVLGRHGSAAYQVLSTESFKKESFDFYSYRYARNESNEQRWQEYLERPDLPNDLMAVYAAIDPGFVDPTVILVMGLDSKQIWRTYVRYRLTRVDFPIQERIINWLDDKYQFSRIGIDVGAGGNGASLLQGLMLRDEYRAKRYNTRLTGVNNSELITVGLDELGREIKQDTKTTATTELVKLIQGKVLRFSEIDFEAVSQLERLAKQRAFNGNDRYYIMSETGKGKTTEDHIYAAYIVWAILAKEAPKKQKKKLGKATSIRT